MTKTKTKEELTRYLTGDQRVSLGADMRAAYEAGASIRDLALQHDRSYGWAHRMLENAGATLRARGGGTTPTTQEATAS